MSRRLGVGLILLALWVQALVPAAALRAEGDWRQGLQEARLADALTKAPLCGHDEGAPSAAALPADPAVPCCEPCALCCSTATAPLPAAPILAPRRLVWRPVGWPTPPPGEDPKPRASARHARAPPSIA